MSTWAGDVLRVVGETRLSQADREKRFLENHIVRTLFLMQSVLLLGIIGLLTWFIRPSEALSVLHYNVYFGVDLLGAWWQTLIFPSISLVFVCVNAVLAYRLYTVKHERIAAYLLLLGSAMVLSGTLLGVIATVYINY